MNKKTCDKRKRAGFTLAELLMVIAIIGVLVVAAIPGVITLRGNLKMMELDSAARTIYIAAQNRMSELRVSGQMSVLQGVSMGINAPSDFPADVLDWDNGEYHYLSQSETGALLPEGAIDPVLYNGDFYIEYNAKTGMVYSVFYAEEPFTYQLGLPRANKSERRANAPMLGYYGGSDVDYGKFDDSLTPDIELENSDVLALRIRYNSALDVDYLVTIEDDEHNVAVFDLTDYFSNPNISYSIEGANAVYTVLLDSMTVGLQLKDIFPEGSGQYLVPGNNLKITVTATTGSDYPSSVSVATNSLFAARDESDVTLSSARHLQNLELSFSGLAADAGIANATQIGDITWPGDNDSRKFISIARAELNTFNGNGNRITSLNAALFASLNGSLGATKTVENVRLVAPEVRAANLDNVGTLVNEARYAEFRNCVVYAEGRTGHLSSDGAENTGGMVGLATDCTFEQCSASLIAITATGATPGSGVGGFAGKLDGGSITKSYGNTGYWQTDSSSWDDTSGIIANGGYAGGFAGVVDGAVIENSYSGGNIRLASGSAAGFSGVTRNMARYTSSYSLVSFEGTASFVSPAGFAMGGTQSNCYFLKRTVSGSAADEAGGITASELQTCMSGNSAFTAANESSTTPYGRTNEIYPFSRLSGMVHYGDWLEEEEESEMGNKLYYYELYSDGSYGYYGYAIDSLRSDLAVREDGYVFMVQSGNSGAIKIECRAYPFTTGININYNQPVSLNFGGYTYKACYLRPNETLMNYATTNTTTNQVVQITFTDKITYTYYFNPNFAKTVSTSSTPSSEYIVRTARHLARLGVLPNYGNLAFVQERDVDFTTYGASGNRPVLTPIKGNTQFKGTYDGMNYRILSGDVNYAGQQNVGLFSYVNENALLKNIRFIAASSGAVISGGENTGGLVGLLEGATVQNCYIEGFDIRGTTRVGGLVGRNNKGNIQSSRVESCKVTATGENLGGFVGLMESGGTATNNFVSGCEISGTNNVGGFVGSITSGTITNCGAANGYFKNQETNGGFVKGTGTGIGGFVGNANGGTVSNCYAVTRLNFSTQTNGFFGAGWGAVLDCYSVALNQNGDFVSFSPSANNSSNVIAYNGYNYSDIVDLFQNNTSFGYANAANTHPYASSLQGRNYPFPTSVKNDNAPVHYGNWYLMSQPVGLFYFEQYSNNTYGFYGSYSDETGSLVSINTLSNTLAVTRDGYANAVRKGGSNAVTAAPGYTWGTSNTSGGYQNASSPVSVSLTLNGTLRDYDFYLLNDLSSSANSQSQSAFYTQVRITFGQTVGIHWFNPSFAKTVVTSASQPSAPSNATAVLVRTARQFSRLGQLSSYNYWARTYLQERDIDFAAYTSSAQTLNCVGTDSGGSAFSGTYDGGYNIITGAGISSDAQHVGLFGYNTGTLRNIVFKSDAGTTRSISCSYSALLSSGAVGALVGYNTGNVTNCAVAGFRVSGTSSSTLSVLYNQIGGFVGYNDGNINNCSAANAQMGNTLGGSVSGASRTNVGGFVGRSDGNINYSYAVATIATGGSRTGSFVGYTESGTIAYCYGVTVNSSNSWITDFRGGSLLGLGGTLTGCTAYNGSNLSAITSNCTTARGFGTASYSYSYGTSGNYPFPAIVKNVSGGYVHHGNWRT